MKAHRHTAAILGLFSLLACLVGCAPPPQAQVPLASGQIIRCSLGDKPVMRAGEIGSWSSRDFTQGRVEIFDRVVIVTEPNGTKHCAPHDWFKEIIFK